jgi:hypothetical protein
LSMKRPPSVLHIKLHIFVGSLQHQSASHNTMGSISRYLTWLPSGNFCSVQTPLPTRQSSDRNSWPCCIPESSSTCGPPSTPWITCAARLWDCTTQRLRLSCMFRDFETKAYPATWQRYWHVNEWIICAVRNLLVTRNMTRLNGFLRTAFFLKRVHLEHRNYIRRKTPTSS